jgi:hypothetical protein
MAGWMTETGQRGCGYDGSIFKPNWSGNEQAGGMMGLLRKKRKTVRLSKVRPPPEWAPYADKMTQELADQIRSDVEELNNWNDERERGDNVR